jgi:hypothetical protein
MNNQTPLTHIYILALTSNTDDEYNEKNYAFREKSKAETQLKSFFDEAMQKHKQDYSKNDIRTAKEEYKRSLKETNEELYQPTFELWSYDGFIKGTVTKTKIQ